MKRLMLTLSLLSGGCAATGHLNTPSGKPEITVQVDKSKVAAACAAWLAQHDYQIEKQTEFSLSGLHNGSLGLTADQMFLRESFTFLTTNGGTTVYATKATVTRNPSGGETEDILRTQSGLELTQNDLNEVRAILQ
jgi:hypothetical protein